MPACATERQERFAIFLAKGMNQTDAYEAAGYKRSQASASKAARKPGVMARVRELQNSAAHRARVSIASLIEEAEAARSGAMEDKQFSAAVAAVREKGIISGLRVEKRDNRIRTMDDMTDAELLQIAQSGGLLLDANVSDFATSSIPNVLELNPESDD